MMMTLNKERKGEKGFTLIELSIVLLIAGLFIAAFLPIYNNYVQERRLVKQEYTINAIRKAMVDFIIDDPNNDTDMAEQRYPCPASPTAQPGSDSYGVEDCSLLNAGIGTCSNGICVREGTGGKRVLVGSVPTRALEIPSTYMVDAYGRRFTYAVSAQLATAGAMVGLTNEGSVKIVDEGNHTITDNAQFALISHGRNGLGAYSAEGVKLSDICTGTADAQNCADDAVFMSARQSHGQNAFYYDDSVAFTLAAQNDDEWWQESDATGRHIVNRNTHNVGIGFSAGNPTERLDVDGSARARKDMKADENVMAGMNVSAGQDVTSGNDVRAGNNVTAAANVNAGADVTAGKNVTAGNNVAATKDVTAGNNVSANRDVTARNNVTADNEVKAKTNVRADKSIYATENFYGKHFFYSDVPSSGGGGGGGTGGLLSAICPEGQVLRGISAGSPICVVMAGGGVGAFNCEAGNYLTGFNADGSPVCTSINAGIDAAGLVQTFNCPGKSQTQWGEDGVSGYNNYPDDWCGYTYRTVSTACIESGVPGRQTWQDNMPTETGFGRLALRDWLNTCGKRFCVQHGFQDGRVTEYGPSGFRPDGNYYVVGGIADASRRPVEIKCTKM